MRYKFQSERMHRTFEQVLHTLPVAVQNVIVDRLDLVTDVPSEAIKAGGAADALGCVKHRTLFVDAAKLINKPAGLLSSVIAHEFAHVALGHHQQTSKALSWEAGEYDANRQAVGWGFASLVSFESLNARPIGGLPKTFGEVQF